MELQIQVPLYTVDTIIAGIRYKGFTDFYGFDTIVISVDDQGIYTYIYLFIYFDVGQKDEWISFIC